MGITLSAESLKRFHDDGFLVVGEVLTSEEAGVLRARAASEFGPGGTSALEVGERGAPKLPIWLDPPDDLFGAVARRQSFAGIAEALLAEEVYHVQSNLAYKDARLGTASEWHQDYPAWYQQGVPSPNVIIAFLALSPATQENGCLQMIKGSHRLGRLDHDMTKKQPSADPTSMSDILLRLPVEYITLVPGDAVFYHANTLHRSGRNNSDQSRWSMIFYYNARSNVPVVTTDYWRYRPLQKLS
jgi:ectoine hydroxylase